MKTEKDAISRVRESRRRISKRFDHDPKKLVAYYMELQEQYKDRLVSEEQPKYQQGKAA